MTDQTSSGSPVAGAMITARKSAWFERVFAIYNRNLIARRFEGLRVAGLEHLRRRPREAPLLLYANHSSWWDGLVAFQVGRAAALDQYVMMEEKQLRAYPLFRRLGAFSVVRERPREAARSIEYARHLLRGTNRALWIFPQGETRPNDYRPLKLYTGAARIIEGTGEVYAAPVGMRYEFLEEYRPDILVRIGPLEHVTTGSAFDPKRATRDFAVSLTGTLDKIRADILQSNLAESEELVAQHRRERKIRHARHL